MNGRRQLLIVLGAAAFAPRVLRAQSKQAPVLIGWLALSSQPRQEHAFTAFRQEMAALGWKEGTQFMLEGRWADGRTDRLTPLTEDLAKKRPAVIVASTIRAVAAANKAAPATPIVLVAGVDPVAAGLAASLSRPGGMVTGITNVGIEVSEKHLELLLEAAPKVRRIGFLLDPTAANWDLRRNTLQRAIARRSIDARFGEAARPAEVEAALLHLAKEGVDALIVMSSNVLQVENEAIIKFALARRWPMVGSVGSAELGVLITYGANNAALYRRAAYFADRILKGAKPGDLPIEQPTKFALVINLKTAKALGITIPQSILVRADRVIE